MVADVDSFSREAAFANVEAATGCKPICEKWELVEKPILDVPPPSIDEKILSVVDKILSPSTRGAGSNSIHSRLRIGADGRVRGPGMKGY